MLTQVDHIDMRVNDLEATVGTLKKMGLQEKRRTPAPRSSVEMALPGENQVTFELRPANGNPQGVHHVAFRQSRPEDVEVLKEQGIVFKTEHATIKDTGRTVSSFPDPNGIMWQLTD